MEQAKSAALRAIGLLDLTSLNGSDREADIRSLCLRVSAAQVAAVCVAPSFVPAAKKYLGEIDGRAVKVATVVNFPQGEVDLVGANDACKRAIDEGADEVDMVFPWRSLMAGDWMVGEEMVRACAKVCDGRVQLKVIVESGQLASPAFIRQASEISIQSGADFIKTSTGKTTVGATPAAAALMAEVIKEFGGTCGLKLSGGIRCATEAQAYLALVEEVLGLGWAGPANFRFGASSLLDALQAVVSGPTNQR